jgi:hypothetical protein
MRSSGWNSHICQGAHRLLIRFRIVAVLQMNIVAVAEMLGDVIGNNGCQRVWRVLKRRLDLGRRFGWRALPRSVLLRITHQVIAKCCLSTIAHIIYLLRFLPLKPALGANF